MWPFGKKRKARTYKDSGAEEAISGIEQAVAGGEIDEKRAESLIETLKDPTFLGRGTCPNCGEISLIYSEVFPKGKVNCPHCRRAYLEFLWGKRIDKP